MFPLAVLALVHLGGLPTPGAQAPEDKILFKEETYDGLLGPKSLMIRTIVDRMPTPKQSPKKFGEPAKPWVFDWTMAGYYKDDFRYRMRFELYSQESTQTSGRANGVLRLLTRLFSYNAARLELDHSGVYGGGLVSVYLCYGGDPGGEQLFDVDRQQEQERKVNSIYLYDLRSFTDPVEMVREVAHEYGHATLPPIGGFTEPEEWANGVLGERLYLTYLAQARRNNELSAEDTLGATPEALDAWVKKNVEPLVEQAATNGPRPALLAGSGKASMDAFTGLALWTQQLFGDHVLSRSLEINGQSAKDLPASIATAAEEPGLITLKIPTALRGRPIWVPVGGGKLIGAKPTATKAGWAQIVAGKGPVVLNTPKKG